MEGLRKNIQVMEKTKSSCFMLVLRISLIVVCVCSVKPGLSSDMDAVQLVSNLAGNFMGVVQYNKDNTLFEV